MTKICYKIIVLKILTAFLLFSGGCTSVVKQNIISSINTGIGATLTENPQTQLYEIKIGYIRSQFYSVPTGKIIEKDAALVSKDADKTPQMVSGIRMESGIKHLFLGVDVSENFAVGDVAVMSPAAVAMYVSQAESPEAAQAASEAIIGSYVKDTAGDLLRSFWKPDGKVNKNNEKVLKAWMEQNGLGHILIPYFIRASQYKEIRKKAVKDLKLE